MPDKIRIKTNKNVCSGCLSCMTTCSMYNEHYSSLAGSRVQITLSPFGGTNVITICQQCTKPKCMEACPENAISRHPDGYMVIDYDKCTSCKLCIPACPFHAMFWNPITEVPIKCELCHGASPQCVEACPTGALTIQVVPAKKTAEPK